MKKYLLVLLLIVFIVPSVAFASWWNPFSWGIFHKTQTSIVTPKTNTEPAKTPEEKISDLQKQLDDLKNEQSIPVSSQKTPVVKEVKKITPVVLKSNQITDVCLNIEGIQTTVPVGYSSTSSICTLIAVQDLCPNIIGTQSKIPDGMVFYKNTGECLTENQINDIENTNIKQQAVQAQIDAQNEAQQEAIQAKQAKLNAVNQQIATLNAKYASDVAKARSAVGTTTEGSDAVVRMLNSQYTIDFDTLQAQWQQIKYSN